MLVKYYKIALISACVFLTACAKNSNGDIAEIPLPYFNEETFTPYWPDESDEKKVLHTIAPFSFIDQNGTAITNETVNGKIYVANFFFSICPTVCPRMTRNLAEIQSNFSADSVIILSHTVMPWVDDVEQLRKYARLNEIDSKQWHLLTGDKNVIYDLARKSYFADEGFGKTVTDESDFLHTEKLILIDQEGHIRGVYNGTLPLETERLAEDIRSLL
jgi:protein SCO1